MTVDSCWKNPPSFSTRKSRLRKFSSHEVRRLFKKITRFNCRCRASVAWMRWKSKLKTAKTVDTYMMGRLTSNHNFYRYIFKNSHGGVISFRIIKLRILSSGVLGRTVLNLTNVKIKPALASRFIAGNCSLLNYIFTSLSDSLPLFRNFPRGSWWLGFVYSLIFVRYGGNIWHNLIIDVHTRQLSHLPLRNWQQTFPISISTTQTIFWWFRGKNQATWGKNISKIYPSLYIHSSWFIRRILNPWIEIRALQPYTPMMDYTAKGSVTGTRRSKKMMVIRSIRNLSLQRVEKHSFFLPSLCKLVRTLYVYSVHLHSVILAAYVCVSTYNTSREKVLQTENLSSMSQQINTG